MSEPPSPVKKISLFFIAVISVLLVLSVISLWQAVQAYRNTGSPDYITIILSVSAIALSSYMFLQMRKKPPKLGFEMPKVFTTIQCSSCEFKSVREFQKGDYILKEAGPCPKCNDQTIISAIYKEVDEKKK